MARFHEQMDTLIREVGEIKTNTALQSHDLKYIKEEQLNTRKRLAMQNQRLRKVEDFKLSTTIKQNFIVTILSFAGAFFGIKAGN